MSSEAHRLPKPASSKSPASSKFKVTLSRRASGRLRAGHVWAYRSDITASADIPAGALVTVQDERGRVLGSALYSGAFEISVRMLSTEIIRDDEALIALVRERVRKALAYRVRVVEGDSDAYRLIFSEADELPGLIVDRYSHVLSLQALTQAMDRAEIKSAVVAELLESLKSAGVNSMVERIDPRIRQLEQLPSISPGLLAGEESSSIYKLNGITSMALPVKKPAPSLTNARTTRQPAITRMAAPLMPSAIKEDSRCIWHASAAASLPSIARAQLWRLLNKMRRSIPDTLPSNGLKPTPLTCCATTPRKASSTTPSSLILRHSQNLNATWIPRCADTKN